MPKRKLEDELEADWKVQEEKPVVKKNSLDSDEEEDVSEENYNVLTADDIEGQEDSTVDFEGDVKLTPFNMKEELEEGHFDTEGNYHWNKEGKLIRDNWLDNIDWVKVNPNVKSAEDEDSHDSSMDAPFDEIAVYKDILAFMKPEETVAKSLRRLGGKKYVTPSRRWCKKNEQKSLETHESCDREKVLELTGLANLLLNKTGNMDIYQESYEFITNKVNIGEEKGVKPAVKADIEVLDMYADDFDEKEKARLQTNKEEMFPPSSAVSDADGENQKDPVEVMWEFKWKQDSTDIYGPHSTSQMQQWVEEGYFKDQVWVKRTGQDSPFYSSRRVDFELYL